MKQKALSLWASGLMLVGVAGTANATLNLITNGSFEATTSIGSFTTLNSGSNAIEGWTVTSGSIDWIGTLWSPSDGNYSIDMNGDSVGTIESDPFTTIVGEDYIVSFDLAGNPDNGTPIKTLELTVAGITTSVQFDTTNQSRTDMGWTTFSYTFTAVDSLTTLEFTGDSTYDNYAWGPALDNVIVVAAPTGSVPVPGTLFLVASSLLGLAGVRHRRMA